MRLCALFVAVVFVSSASANQNWPGLHGPNADSKAPNARVPLTWDDKKNVVWKTPIHGAGWSSPVIWGNQIWLTTATPNGKRMSALCIDKKTGRIERDLLLFENAKPRFCHPMNSYASPTPAIEEGRVYIHFGSYGTACLDTGTGKILWKRTDLECNHFRGPGSSPILYGDSLIVHYDGFDLQYVVAFDKKSGKTLWKVDRKIDYGTKNGDFKKAYNTPIVINVNGKSQLISPTSKACIAYDPANGKEIWRVRYKGFSSTARPMFDGKLVFVNTGFGATELIAVKPTGTGDVTDTHIEWRTKTGVPRKPSQVLVNGLIYQVNDKGVGSCLDAKNGNEVWQGRINKGEHSASLLFANGHIFISSHNGDTAVIKPSRKLEKVATNKLPGGFMSSPAISGNTLFLRTKTHLYRIEQK